MKAKLIWLAGAVALIMLTAGVYAGYQKAAKAALCRQNAHFLELTVDRWNIDHSSSVLVTDPTTEDFSVVIRDGYLTHPPLNPYTHQPVVELRPGQASRPGNFRFITRRAIFQLEDGSQRAEATSYGLAVYGPGKLTQPQFKDFGFRLGREPLLVLLEAGISKRSWDEAAMSPEDLHLHRTARFVREETWDEALTRQGY